jgi:hypothetical protein
MLTEENKLHVEIQLFCDMTLFGLLNNCRDLGGITASI